MGEFDAGVTGVTGADGADAVSAGVNDGLGSPFASALAFSTNEGVGTGSLPSPEVIVCWPPCRPVCCPLSVVFPTDGRTLPLPIASAGNGTDEESSFEPPEPLDPLAPLPP